MSDNTLDKAPGGARTAIGMGRAAWPELVALWKRYAEPLTLFVSWRLGLAVLAFLAALLIPPYAPHNGVAPYKLPDLAPWANHLLGVWSHWDGEWFLHIAQAGYVPGEFSAPFFPLYPLLTRLFGLLLGNNFLLAGVLVSAAAALTAFVVFYQLVSFEFTRRRANEAVLYLTVFPTSFFLAACYSEGLFLALTLGAFLAARRYQKWWLVGLLVGLASLCRNLGPLLLLPLGWEWLREQWQLYKVIPAQKRLVRFYLAGVVEFLGLIGPTLLCVGGWLYYQAVTLGNPFEFMAVQSMPMWDRQGALPWQTVWQSLQMAAKSLSQSTQGFKDDHNLLDLMFWLFLLLVLLIAVWQTFRKQLPVSYLLYFAVAFVLPLLSPSKTEPLMSVSRFTLVIFPVFMVLARLGERRRFLRYVYVSVGLFLLALLFSRFAGWYWVA